jgi:peptide/nickel transport system substrate-binding protein
MLVGLDDKPLLATGWHWDSPTSFVVDLRDGVKFSNGEPFVARDVVFSMCRMMYRVDGKPNVLTSSLSPVTNVTAVDDHTVRFDTTAPYPIIVQKLKFLKILSAAANGITSDITYDNKGDCGIVDKYPTQADFDQGKAAIGTGPYLLSDFEATGDAVLTRNDAYWGDKPEWDKVEIRSVPNNGARTAGLMAGDFDVIEKPSAEDLTVIQKDGNFAASSTPGLQTIFIVLDTNPKGAAGVTAADGSAPLADKRVRQALSMAIDRDAIVARLFQGNATAANEFAPNYMNGAPEMPPLKADPEGAKKLLAEAGYPDGFEIELSVPNDRYTNGALVAQAIVQYWTRLGLKVNLVTEPWSVFLTKRGEDKLGAFMYGWGHPQGAGQLISGAFAQKAPDLGLGSANLSHYDSPAFEKPIRAWAVETDDAKAKALLAEAMKQAMDDMPGIPLYYNHEMWAHRADLTVAGSPDGHTLAMMVHKK